MSVGQDKKALRATALQRRADAARAALDAPSRLREHFHATFERGHHPVAKGDVVSGYLAVRDEMDPASILVDLDARGVVLGLPVVVERAHPLVFRRYAPGDLLEPSTFGLEVPPVTAPVVVPQLLLVPLLAFDADGFRLGYGGGFYDRTLERLRASPEATVCAVGVAYAAQEVQGVPRDPNDQPLDWIITEDGAIRVR